LKRTDFVLDTFSLCAELVAECGQAITGGMPLDQRTVERLLKGD
jgi:hypothetical protein